MIVSTANAHESRMLKHRDGLKPFTENGVDVLLMQEVLGMRIVEVEERLNRSEYELVHCEPLLGLAIGVHAKSQIQTTETDTTILHRTGPIEKALKFGQNSHRLRERGMIGAGLILASGIRLTVATAHPIVFIRSLARRKQISAMGDALNKPFYATDRLVVGGD